MQTLSTNRLTTRLLRPVRNRFREYTPLDGVWQFRPDPDDIGVQEGWGGGLEHTRPIAVPASWNEQYSDLAEFFGRGWYERRFTAAPGSGRTYLRFDAAFYHAEVWLNGMRLGDYEGGYLPFAFEVSDLLSEENLLVVSVDGRLGRDTVPAYENADGDNAPGILKGQHPPVDFDFFPYSGLHRSVSLLRLPEGATEDLTVVTTPSPGGRVRITVKVEHGGHKGDELRLELCGEALSQPCDDQTVSFNLTLDEPQLWSPAYPTLHELRVTLLRKGEAVDLYTLPVGLRWVEVKEGRLLLNGAPVYLRGFGKHEDAPHSGRGVPAAANIRDFDLMSWCGANSFRTSHYPYAEEMLDLADQLGFLVIDETPAVSLRFGGGWQERLRRCRVQLEHLLQRDKNRPSVILWSLANEPHADGETSQDFFAELCDLARASDPTRPLTLVSRDEADDRMFELVDVACVNRYYGWYTQAGRLEEGVARLEEELRRIHQAYGKPIILSEFGADAVAGIHASPPTMFSEEYQAAFLRRYIACLEELPFVIGQHVWAFADFRTAQGSARVGATNRKGVFTRTRAPKLAAHVLHELWGKYRTPLNAPEKEDRQTPALTPTPTGLPTQ